jgi:hypothetical protein
MFRWIHWTAVENRMFPGTITGEATISSIGPIRPLQATMGDGSTVLIPGLPLRASVTYHYAGASGGDTAKTFSLDGLVAMVSSAPGLWQIQEFTQDGKTLGEFVAPVDVPVTSGDVRVTFDTLIITPDHWTLGVQVSNQTTAEIALKEAVLTQPTGSPIGRLPLVAPSSIRGGQSADVLIEMLPQAITGDLKVALLAGTSNGDYPFSASLSQLLAHVPPSQPAASPAPSPSPS